MGYTVDLPLIGRYEMKCFHETVNFVSLDPRLNLVISHEFWYVWAPTDGDQQRGSWKEKM